MKRNNYKATLEMAGIKYTGEGETIYDAMDTIALDWYQIKAKGVMTIICGKASAQMLFYIRPLRRIFANKLTKRLWAKRLELFLKEKEAARQSEDGL